MHQFAYSATRIKSEKVKRFFLVIILGVGSGLGTAFLSTDDSIFDIITDWIAVGIGLLLAVFVGLVFASKRFGYKETIYEKVTQIDESEFKMLEEENKIRLSKMKGWQKFWNS